MVDAVLPQMRESLCRCSEDAAMEQPDLSIVQSDVDMETPVS